MLVVFDIDGTLTRTVDVDTEAYAVAFRQTFGADLPSLDWASYEHATESGVAAEAARLVLGRDLAPAELDAMQDVFVALLREAMTGLPPAELEMPGAGELLRRLVDGGHQVALATGCWLRSAEAKLKAAGLDYSGFPMATADDSVEREEIMRIAAARAGHDPGERHVYVGDGLWDMHAAAALGWDFIGIGPSGCKLQQRGVPRLLPHFAGEAGGQFLSLLVQT